MVLACESIFSRTSLDGRPQNLHTFSKVNLKCTKCSFPIGQARCSFHLPHSYNLQFLLARGNGASTNVEPWHLSPQIGPNYQFDNLQTLIFMNFRPTSSDKVSIIHFNFLIEFGNPFNPKVPLYPLQYRLGVLSINI